MILAMTGKAGAGKTTASDYLVQNYGFQKINFKDALVAEMKKKLPDVLREMSKFYHLVSPSWKKHFGDAEVSEEELIKYLFSDKPPIMRTLMQNYGTEVRRADDKNYWITKWANSLVDKDKVVVDDCRFLNEADAVKLLGGKIIRVEKTDYVERMVHASETEMDSIEPDFIVKSKTGGHKNLYEQLDKIMHETE